MGMLASQGLHKVMLSVACLGCGKQGDDMLCTADGVCWRPFTLGICCERTPALLRVDVMNVLYSVAHRGSELHTSEILPDVETGPMMAKWPDSDSGI